MRFRTALTSLLATTTILTVAPVAQGAQAPADQPPRGPLMPDTPIAKGYNDAAKALADVDDNPIIDWQYRIWCVTGYGSIGPNDKPDQLPPGEITDYMSPRGFSYTSRAQALPPNGLKFMDNAWYFGTDHTGAFVIRTDDGLVLYDTLTTLEDVETQLLAPMQRAGLNPADIKYIFMGHGHGDHTGGANLIRQRYNPNVKFVMGGPDADAIAASRQRVMSGQPQPGPGGAAAAPLTDAQKAARLMTLPDPVDIQVRGINGFRWGAQRIQMGATELVAILNPGHTPGQLSAIVPVVHKGQKHKILLWSGNDSPQNAALYGASGDWVRTVAYLEGADVYGNSHAYQGATFLHMRRAAADPNYNNPMIMGVDGLQRSLGVFSNCQRAWVERSKTGTWKRF